MYKIIINFIFKLNLKINLIILSFLALKII